MENELLCNRQFFYNKIIYDIQSKVIYLKKISVSIIKCFCYLCTCIIAFELGLHIMSKCII